MHPFHPFETLTTRMAGELRAAVPLYGGPPMADPLHA